MKTLRQEYSQYLVTTVPETTAFKETVKAWEWFAVSEKEEETK